MAKTELTTSENKNPLLPNGTINWKGWGADRVNEILAELKAASFNSPYNDI